MPEPTRNPAHVQVEKSGLARSWPWFALVVMGLVASVLGYLGFQKVAAASGAGDTPLDLIHRTLQLFVLESGYVPGGVPWELEVARTLAPLVPAWAVLQTIWMLFRGQREAFWMRRRRDHVVICGLGRKGFQLVRDFRAAGDDVLVIEADPDNRHLPACRALGAHVIIGSCQDISLLRRARVDRARHLVLITGDDGTNVETAILTHRLLSETEGGDRFTLWCHVEVVDLNLSRLLERHDLLSAPGVKLQTRIFNSYQNSARALFGAQPLEPAGFGADDPRSIHLVVFGFGQMGEAVALQAAKIGHFANGKPLKITVIDEHAEAREAGFRNRYPRLEDISDLEIRFMSADFESPLVMDELKGWAADTRTVTTVAVCRDDDAASLICALNIVTALHPVVAPVHVRMSQESGLAALLEGREDAEDWTGKVHPFGMTSLNATRNILLNRERDILARAFHRNYVEQARRDGRTIDAASLAAWDDLAMELKDSNRLMADHLAVKLRVLGEGATPDAATEEVLARMEHARWCAERYLAGWRTGPHDPERKAHPDLVPWEDLAEEERSKDREAVRCIPRILKLVEPDSP